MKKTLWIAGALFGAVSLGFADEVKKDPHGHGAVAAAAAAGDIPRSESPKGAKCYIIFPRDGATVGEEFTVRFGLKGMGVAPAGVDIPNTGHHHLMIDSDKFDADAPFPMSETHLHFGGGQTEATVKLAPGEHTLMLVLGDKLHIPHQPPVASKMITITVVEGEGPKGKGGETKEEEGVAEEAATVK